MVAQLLFDAVAEMNGSLGVEKHKGWIIFQVKPDDEEVFMSIDLGIEHDAQ